MYNLDFLITIPRNLSNYYTSKYINIVKTSFEKFHYDLFNPKDSIYRDICLPFYIDSSDLTLKDRSSLFLPNNLCPENCIYKSIKFFNIILPSGVSMDSGWNWTPYIG